MITQIKKGDVIKIHYPTGDSLVKHATENEDFRHSDSAIIEFLSKSDDSKAIDANESEVKVGDTVFIVLDSKLMKGQVAYIYNGHVTVRTSIEQWLLSTSNPKDQIVKIQGN
jgi:hypothetical protein